MRPSALPNALPNFNHLAWVYRCLEYATFGPWLERCRTHFLIRVDECRPALGRALVLGDGDGRFTARLAVQCPAIRIHAVDGSPAMIQALRRATGFCEDRITTEVADLRSWRPVARLIPQPIARLGGYQGPGKAGGYDLIATHFVLDCLSTEEVFELADRINPTLRDNALWLVSEFAIPEGLYGRLIAKPIVSLLYIGFGLLTGLRVRSLPDHPQALRQAGWTLQTSQAHCGGLLRSELWRQK